MLTHAGTLARRQMLRVCLAAYAADYMHGKGTKFNVK